MRTRKIKYSIGQNVDYISNDVVRSGEITFLGNNFAVVLRRDIVRANREVVVELNDIKGVVNE